MRQRCPCLQLSRWHAQDKEPWIAAKCPSPNVLSRRKRRSGWRPAYWKILEEAYGCFLGWLLLSGLLDWTVEPTQRCSNERLVAYIDYMRDRVRPETALHRVVHLGIALSVLGDLPDGRMFTSATRQLRRLARKSRRSVRPPPPARLKALGIKLMALAESGLDLRPRVNAVLFRDGLLIAVLAHHPLRRRNWAEIRIDFDLVCIGGQWWIAPKHGNVKNRKASPRRWPQELIPALKRYLDVHRPILIGDGDRETDALWITYRGKPEAPATLSLAVARRTHAEFGRSWRPQAFRRSAASAATVEDAAALLGNTPAVVQKSYAPPDRSAALHRHMEVCRKLFSV